MKLNKTTLLTLLNKSILLLTEDEFRAVAFVLSWEVITYERWNNFLRLRIQHEESIIDVHYECLLATQHCKCFIGPVGYMEKLRGNANTLTLFELAQQFRRYYCREYGVTIWKCDTNGYTRQQLNEMSDLLLQLIF